jgi:taurine--2-oxoglutarate transaminase
MEPMESLDYIDEILHLENDTVAGIIVEPIFGNHGVIVPPEEYLPRLKELPTNIGHS